MEMKYIGMVSPSKNGIFAAAHGEDFSIEMTQGYMLIDALKAAKEKAVECGLEPEEYRVIDHNMLYSINLYDANYIINQA